MQKEFFYDLLVAKQIIPAKMVDAMQAGTDKAPDCIVAL